MAPWLWKAYNDALDRHKNDGWYGPEYYYSRPRDREGLIASALKLAKTYPPRPAQPLPSSPSVDALRAVLADAPRIADVEWGKEVPGLAFSTTWHPEYDEWYSWTSEILQPIFEALIGVIEAHGVGDDGWASARWEVYDRVRPLCDSCASHILTALFRSMRSACRCRFHTTVKRSVGRMGPRCGLRVDYPRNSSTAALAGAATPASDTTTCFPSRTLLAIFPLDDLRADRPCSFSCASVSYSPRCWRRHMLMSGASQGSTTFPVGLVQAVDHHIPRVVYLLA